MIENKQQAVWTGVAIVLVCLFAAGRRLLDRPPVVSAGNAVDSRAELRRGEEISAGIARERAEDAKRRQELLRSFTGLLDGPPERLAVEAVLRGDSAAAARMAKIWALSEPGNPVARSLAEGFACAGASGKGNCADYNSNEEFYNWRRGLKVRYPDNRYVIMMTAGIAPDLDAVADNFNKAVKIKGSDLGFNFDVPLCAYWLPVDMTDRLREDWRRDRSVPAGLRLVQRLTRCDAAPTASEGTGEEAARVLKTLIKICPAGDLEAVLEAYLAGNIRRNKGAR